MTQEFEQRKRWDQFDAAVDITSREPLSVDAVDRIIRRAVELQVEDDLALPSLDERSLHRVARELGIEPGHLRRAVAEARTSLDRPEPSMLDRVLAPSSVVESSIMHGDRESVEARIGDWMHRQEGLRLRRKNPDGAVWERDPHVLTKLRMAMRMGRGSRVLRNSRKVAHRIQEIRADEQAVALEAETHTLRTVGASAVATLGAVASAGAAWGTAAGAPEIAIPAAVAGFALGSGAIIAGVKVWLGRVRDGLRRVLDSVSSPAPEPEDPLERQLQRLRRNWKSISRDFRGPTHGV